MKKDKEKVLVVAQEIHFAKALAANDKQLRERALKRLNKWLCMKSKSSLDFTEEGFMRIWKGLFYCVWMSDKPLIQEDTVEAISHLLHCFVKFEDALKFIRCFHQAMSQAWFGLDQHRLDKFMMLVRRFTRQSFAVLKKHGWNVEQLKEFSQDLQKALTVAPIGLIIHLADVYIVELSKVGEGALNSEIVIELVRPWAELLATQSDPRLINAIKRHVFIYLIRQTDVAIKHSIKFEAWKNCGFPGGDIDMMEEVSEEEGEEEVGEEDEDGGEKFLDPRAGRADVILPPVDFHPSHVVELLHSIRSSPHTIPSRARKSISNLIDKFKELEKGQYPLGMRKVEKVHLRIADEEEEVDDAVERLGEFENRMYDEEGTKKRRKFMGDLDEDDVLLSDESGRRKRKAVDEFGPSTSGVKRRRSSGVWDISFQESSSEGDITLELTPHSLNSSWTVDEMSPKVADEEALPAVANKRKRGKTKQFNGQTKSSESSSPFIFSAPSSTSLSSLRLMEVDEAAISVPSSGLSSIHKKKAKLKRANGEVEIIIPAESTTPGKVSSGRSKKMGTPSSEKKVAFVLSKNQAQDAEEYVRSVENSPSIPYDASKKPLQGVLKATNIISPINPFYIRNKFNRKKSM